MHKTLSRNFTGLITVGDTESQRSYITCPGSHICDWERMKPRSSDSKASDLNDHMSRLL